jgi:hypothetical protein
MKKKNNCYQTKIRVEKNVMKFFAFFLFFWEKNLTIFPSKKKRREYAIEYSVLILYIWYLCDISHKKFGMAVCDSVYGRKMIHIHSVYGWKVIHIHSYVR